MQTITAIHERTLMRLLYRIILLIVLSMTGIACAAQVQCRDSLNYVIQAYNSGEWQKTRNAAADYVKSVKTDKTSFQNDAGGVSKLADCATYLPQVYYYLIKSCIRLYDLESARDYYKQALMDELEINLDTADSNTKQYFSYKRVQFSLGGYAGITTTSNKTHAGFKIGVQYGMRRNFRLEAYGEVSFSQRYFNHNSSQRVGAFGSSLPYNAAAFPNYNFTISGRERFLDLLYFAKFPINLPFIPGTASNVRSYISTGIFISYYLGSTVNSYHISNNKSATDTTVYKSDVYSRTVNGLDMDLKTLYGNRLSFGMVYGFGYKFKISKTWLMFTELRYTLGTNFKYKFDEFKNYKVGVSYLSFLIGFRKNTNVLKEIKVN